MGRVVRFSEFEDYYAGLQNRKGPMPGTILDANVIIALSYPPKKFHTRIFEFLRRQIYSKNIPCFTTVNTTAEFLEFHRRLLMTEDLRDSVDEFSKANLSNKKRQTIRYYSQKLKQREITQGADPVFYDREIKNIREKFCSSGSKGLSMWNSLCNTFLYPKLYEEYQSLQKLNVKYLSSYKDEQRHLFSQKITWESAIDICATTCVGFSDAMILNALQASKFQFVISLDSDIAYAVLSDSSLKDVVMPDGLISENNELQKLVGEQAI